MFRVCGVFAGAIGVGECIAMGSLLIVNQVLVRFGRAGRLGGFDRAARAAGLDRRGRSVTGRHGLSDLAVGDRVSAT